MADNFPAAVVLRVVGLLISNIGCRVPHRMFARWSGFAVYLKRRHEEGCDDK